MVSNPVTAAQVAAQVVAASSLAASPSTMATGSAPTGQPAMPKNDVFVAASTRLDPQHRLAELSNQFALKLQFYQESLAEQQGLSYEFNSLLAGSEQLVPLAGTDFVQPSPAATAGLQLELMFIADPEQPSNQLLPSALELIPKRNAVNDALMPLNHQPGELTGKLKLAAEGRYPKATAIEMGWEELKDQEIRLYGYLAEMQQLTTESATSDPALLARIVSQQDALTALTQNKQVERAQAAHETLIKSLAPARTIAELTNPEGDYLGQQLIEPLVEGIEWILDTKPPLERPQALERLMLGFRRDLNQLMAQFGIASDQLISSLAAQGVTLGADDPLFAYLEQILLPGLYEQINNQLRAAETDQLTSHLRTVPDQTIDPELSKSLQLLAEQDLEQTFKRLDRQGQPLTVKALLPVIAAARGYQLSGTHQVQPSAALPSDQTAAVLQQVTPLLKQPGQEGLIAHRVIASSRRQLLDEHTDYQLPCGPLLSRIPAYADPARQAALTVQLSRSTGIALPELAVQVNADESFRVSAAELSLLVSQYLQYRQQQLNALSEGYHRQSEPQRSVDELKSQLGL